MIEFLRNFIGSVPDLSSVYDIGALIEWVFGAVFLLAVMLSIYAIFGNIISFFRRR